ncbi:MAG: ABC transporter permease [Gammaproteobacteria bacterium]|nr:ABC transporter permease [Gammaproteobacteria bacterium]
MLKLVIHRIGLGVLTLWVVSVLVFAGTEILPGDVAQAILGQNATPEAVAAIREQLDLNRPAPVRYREWLVDMLHGHLGVSLASNMPISALVSERLGNTLLLAGLTAALSIPLALAMGLAAALFAGGRVDRFLSMSMLLLLSVPEYFIAAVLVLVFAVHLQWLPAISYVTEYESLWQLAGSLALPILTLTTSVVAHMARMTRAAVLNVMDSPYIELAVLKGIPMHRVVFRHALLNALGPVVNVVALNLAYLVSGVVIVEVMFAYPGLAKLMVDAVTRRDMPLVQACAMIFSTAYLLLILAADILALLANPRLRQSA